MTILYLDLNKAVQIPSTSTDRTQGRTAARSYDESFDRRGSGALGGDPMSGTSRGAKFSDDGADDEIEATRKREAALSAERGLTQKTEDNKLPKAEDTNKALATLSDMRKSLKALSPIPAVNHTEMEFLTVVKGFSAADVVSGRATISGHARVEFNRWLHERFSKSLEKLAR